MDQTVESRRDRGFPWYVKAALAVVLLVILFVVAVDLLEFASSLS